MSLGRMFAAVCAVALGCMATAYAGDSCWRARHIRSAVASAGLERRRRRGHQRWFANDRRGRQRFGSRHSARRCGQQQQIEEEAAAFVLEPVEASQPMVQRQLESQKVTSTRQVRASAADIDPAFTVDMFPSRRSLAHAAAGWLLLAALPGCSMFGAKPEATASSKRTVRKRSANG